MYKLFLLILFLPMSVFSQDETLYLNSNNELSKQKAEFKCVKNASKSREYSRCYDCMNTSGKVVKELNMNLFVMKSLTDDQNKPYIKLAENNSHYLVGELMADKPWNGFFKQPGGVLELKIFAFYKDGKQLNQLYRDAFKDLLKDKEPDPFTILEDKNTYANAVLQNGMEIIEDKNNDRSMDAVRFVKAGKTDHIILSLFAAYYAELIKMSNLENGYQLESIGKGSVKVIYTANGRKLDFFDVNEKPILSLGFVQYPFNSFNKLDKTLPIAYFERDGQLYLEQMTSRPKEGSGIGDKDTRMLLELARALYTRTSIDQISLTSLLVNSGSAASGGALGYYVTDEGKAYGVAYSMGNKEGTYNVDFYENGILNVKHPVKIKNKSLAEIADLLKTIK